MRKLSQYHWPGNIRELQNVIERAVILAHNGRLSIDPPDAEGQYNRARPANTELPPMEGIMTESELRQLECNNIKAALNACKGRVSGPDGAAAILGIRPMTLSSRIKVLRIDRDDG